jgi:hypothetical protein
MTCKNTKPIVEFRAGRARRCISCDIARAARDLRDREAAEERRRERRKTWTVGNTTFRKCRSCSEIRELTDGFYRARSVLTGNPTLDYQYDCKVCQRKHVAEQQAWMRTKRADFYRAQRAAQTRAWRKNNAERYRAGRVAYMERLAADPARRAAFLESKRISHRLRRELQDGVSVTDIKPRDVTAPGAERRGGLLPSRPLADKLALVFAAENDGDLAIEDFCVRVGITDRTLRAWQTGERPSVRFDAADRVLVALGLLWWDVWTSPEDAVIAERVFEGERQAA